MLVLWEMTLWSAFHKVSCVEILPVIVTPFYPSHYWHLTLDARWSGYIDAFVPL